MAEAPHERPRRRWFRLTPDRVVIALLILEGFLLLSEWFEWFAFNRHKGWTVLIGMAAVVVAMLLMSLWFLAALLFRLRFQFSILSLLVLTLVVAVPCSWLAVEREHAQKQREAVAAIQSLRGQITYDYEADEWARCLKSGAVKWAPVPPGPAWVRRLLGDDFFADVVNVNGMILTLFNDRPGSNSITDAWLEHIGKLHRLEVLDLGNSHVSDAGLKELHGLTRLRKLDLHRTNITDAGLKELQGLTYLQELNLAQTPITDAGMEYVAKLTRLEALNLCFAHISDGGVEKLQGLTRLRKLNLNYTSITDAGLEYIGKLARLEVLNLNVGATDVGLAKLEGLSRLQELYVPGSNTTDASLKHIGRLARLKVLDLWGAQVTDAGLEHLNGLCELRRLNLLVTRATKGGVWKLRRALPKCQIAFEIYPDLAVPALEPEN
jgi:Leucine-rich repeat (LRR) protein